MESSNQQKHFVLIHGACHGAWCWYKLKPLLEAAGHKVTAPDLSAAGINSNQISDIRTVYDYNSPLIDLLDSIPSNNVILVGHSLGGMNISLAIEKFPDKISAAVFLAAFMPDTDHVPSYVLQKDLELAKMLIRPSSLFVENFYEANKFTEEGFGSVKKVYIVCRQDEGIPEEFQDWLIENGRVTGTMEIKEADHMAMLSRPQELCQCLLNIADDFI